MMDAFDFLYAVWARLYVRGTVWFICILYVLFIVMLDGLFYPYAVVVVDFLYVVRSSLSLCCMDWFFFNLSGLFYLFAN